MFLRNPLVSCVKQFLHVISWKEVVILCVSPDYGILCRILVCFSRDQNLKQAELPKLSLLPQEAALSMF